MSENMTPDQEIRDSALYYAVLTYGSPDVIRNQEEVNRTSDIVIDLATRYEVYIRSGGTMPVDVPVRAENRIRNVGQDRLREDD